jgi:hypothetical protein
MIGRCVEAYMHRSGRSVSLFGDEQLELVTDAV